MFQEIALTNFLFTDCYLIIVLIFFVNGQVNILQYALPLYYRMLEKNKLSQKQNQRKRSHHLKRRPSHQSQRKRMMMTRMTMMTKKRKRKLRMMMMVCWCCWSLVNLTLSKIKSTNQWNQISPNFNFLNLAITGTKSFSPSLWQSNSVILWYFTPDVLIYPHFQTYFCSLGG